MDILKSIDGEILSAVTSICALFVSVLSIIITLVFSRLQVIHNKNSVKPISSIQFDDYEDKIAVTLQNVGTGPLIIKQLFLKEMMKHTHP